METKEEVMINCAKVTLSSGKVVLLHEMKMKYEELAIRAVGNRAGKDEMLAGKMMQDELMKILLIECDGKKLGGLEKENLESLFSYKDIIEIRKAVQELMGVNEVQTPKLELSRTSGGK